MAQIMAATSGVAQNADRLNEFHHRVYEDGAVTPSMICGKCDFHDYVILDRQVAPEAVTP